MPAALPLTKGQSIDQYTVIEEIANTHAAYVYLVRHAQLHKAVALKISKIYSDKAQEHTTENASFALESKILMELSNNGHIAKFMQAGEYKGHPFFVMQYYSATCAKLLAAQKEGMSFTKSLAIVKQTLKGLASLHEKEILHLDIKPENLFLDDAQQVYLADFNAAFVLPNSPYYALFGLDSAHGKRDVLKHTPAYSSPELKKVALKLSNNKALTVSSDLYSIGVLWGELLSGQTSCKLSKQTSEKSTNATTQINQLLVESKAPTWALNLIEKLLSEKVSSRPLSANDCLQIIEYQEQIEKQALEANQTITLDLGDMSSHLGKIRNEVRELLIKKGQLSSTDMQKMSVLYSQGSDIDARNKVIQQLELIKTETQEELTTSLKLGAWFSWVNYLIEYQNKKGNKLSHQAYIEMRQVGRATRPDKNAFADELMQEMFIVNESVKTRFYRLGQFFLLLFLMVILLYYFSEQDTELAIEQVKTTYAQGTNTENNKEVFSAKQKLIQKTAQQSQSEIIDKPTQSSALVTKVTDSHKQNKGTYTIKSAGGEELKLAWVSIAQLPGIRVMQTEVSQQLYDLCISDGFCRKAKRYSTNQSQQTNKFALHPKTNISWDRINSEFIPWINMRSGKQFDLPSFEQWQKFGLDSAIENGKVHCRDCEHTFQSQALTGTIAVGSLRANQFGLYDVFGNAQEWLKDCWVEQSALTQAYQRCDQAIVVGGSWYSQKVQWQKQATSRLLKNASTPTTGFRLVEYTNRQ